MDSRKTLKNRKFARKSSLPLDGAGTLHPNFGLCRTESIHIVLDCSQGSGICLGQMSSCGRGYTITQIVPDSVAERCGCIQKGDRLLSLNKLYNLDVTTIRQILGDLGPKSAGTNQGQNWVELEIEFDMSDSVIPSSGVFNVKLAKQMRSGLGITVNGSSHGAFIISEVKAGSPAHRTGSLRPGDILLAVDSHPLQHFNIDLLLKDNINDYTTLTIKRNSLPDFLFDAQQRSNGIYTNVQPENNNSGDENKFRFLPKLNDYHSENKSSFKSGNFNIDDSLTVGPVATIRRPFLNRMAELTNPDRVIRNGNISSVESDLVEDPYGDPELYNIEYPPRLMGLVVLTIFLII